MMLKDDKGSAALELVIVAPALLLLITLIVGSGRIMSTKSALESVAREAARWASQSSDPEDAVFEGKERADDVATGLDLDPGKLQTAVGFENFDRGSPISVSVRYELNLSDLPGFGLIPGSFSVSAVQVDTIERYKSR